MTNKIFFPQPIIPVGPTPPQKPASASLGKQSFQEVLQQAQQGGLKFSAHAQQRLVSRNIVLNQQELTRLQAAVEKAAQKGAKESLVLMQDLALVVSVKNRTVITAVDQASMKDNVFTNIDSAVIL